MPAKNEESRLYLRAQYTQKDKEAIEDIKIYDMKTTVFLSEMRYAS